MPRTKEEILEKAKLARRERYAKIKSDPERYAREKEKERQRYLKRKEAKKILSIQDLTPKARKLQRKKWRENFRKHYHMKLLHKRGLELMDVNTPSGSDTDDPLRFDNDVEQEPLEVLNHNLIQDGQELTNSLSDEANSIILKMKKKIRKFEYLLKKKEQMHKLQVQNLEKKVNSYRKYCQRLKKRLESPNSKALRLINDKTKINEVKKKVLFGEAIKKTLETKYQGMKSKKDKKTFSENILPHKNILKEHKVLSEIKTFTVREKKETFKQNSYEQLKEDIVSFFDRDDVSRITAGKKECITRDKIKKQKRYLLDSMKNLHKIFEAENTKVSYSYFCKQRPFWVLIPDVSDRETCLCKTHANIELLAKVLHSNKIIKEKDSKEVINSLCCSNTTCLMKRCNTCKDKKLEYILDNSQEISFKKWEHKKETYISKGMAKEKRVIAKVKVTVTPKEAAIEFENAIPVFLYHEGIRRWQYTAMTNLKKNLKTNEAIVHIDFSENYAFKYNAEVQSFHFGGSRKELTLHTSVIYLTDQNGQMTVNSFCTLSENMRHDAAAVWAHIVPVLEYIQATNQNVNYLHFLSDSPSSQYRNKTMFYIISKLYWYFPILKLVTWNFSEAGHGKGAADGVGGTVKRIADAAVARGKDIVNIEDFMTNVTQSIEKITLKIVDDYQIYEKDLLIPSDKLKPLKGTNKVHQVLWINDCPDLIFREASCFICLSGDCNHVKYIGKLSYEEITEKRQTNAIQMHEENIAGVHIESGILRSKDDFLIQKVKSKETLLSTPFRSANNSSGKENVHITSNIVIKPAQKNYVTKLSDIKPDNKFHLSPDFNINEMVNLYDVNIETCNFSGVFENFVSSSILQDKSDTRSNSQVDFDLLSSESKSMTIAPNNNLKLPPSRRLIFSKNNPPIASRFQINEAQTPSTSKIQTPKIVNIATLQKSRDDLSSSDEDLEIFPSSKKRYFL